MTECEWLLWSRLRKKQLHDVQFYWQKPIGSCIVNFYAQAAERIVEVYGLQRQGRFHFENVLTVMNH